MSSSTETETWPLATLTRKIRQRMQRWSRTRPSSPAS